MTGQIIRLRPPDRCDPDAVHRDPADTCTIIVLPIVRVERFNDDTDNHHPRRRGTKAKRYR